MSENPICTPPDIRSFIFDLDGTLVDSYSSIRSALAWALQEVGHESNEIEFQDHIGPPIRQIVKRIRPDMSAEDLSAVEALYRQQYDDKACLSSPLFPGVGSTLQILSGIGRRLYIVTNKPYKPTIRILASHGILDLFSDIFTRGGGQEDYQSKSHMLQALLMRHHLDKESTVMVGDTREDMSASTNNGIRFLHAAYGYEQFETHRCLTQFDEILEFLKAGVLNERASNEI